MCCITYLISTPNHPARINGGRPTLGTDSAPTLRQANTMALN